MQASARHSVTSYVLAFFTSDLVHAGTDASSVRVCVSGDAVSSGWFSLEKSDRKVPVPATAFPPAMLFAARR